MNYLRSGFIFLEGILPVKELKTKGSGQCRGCLKIVDLIFHPVTGRIVVEPHHCISDLCVPIAMHQPPIAKQPSLVKELWLTP